MATSIARCVNTAIKVVGTNSALPVARKPMVLLSTARVVHPAKVVGIY